MPLRVSVSNIVSFHSSTKYTRVIDKTSDNVP